MSSKIDDYLALGPASFTRLERMTVVPSDRPIGDAIDLTMEVGRDDGAVLVLHFDGVTGLTVDDLRASRPDFLEVTDMQAERGWERDVRYAVRDCCQGPLAFHCADFGAVVRAVDPQHPTAASGDTDERSGRRRSTYRRLGRLAGVRRRSTTESSASDDVEVWIRARLVWSLRWIAAEPELAIRALTFSDGTGSLPADEIALTLEDAWIVIDANGLLSDDVRKAIGQLDTHFATFSGAEQEALWSYDAIRSDPLWSTARQMARDLLVLLGESRDDDHLLGNV